MSYNPGARFPAKAVIDLDKGTLVLDGEPFPWHITSDGISVSNLGDREAIPVLTFSIFADTVQVIPKAAP